MTRLQPFGETAQTWLYETAPTCCKRGRLAGFDFRPPGDCDRQPQLCGQIADERRIFSALAITVS